MIRKTVSLGSFNSSLFSRLSICFAKQKINKGRVQTVGFANDSIINIKNLNYKVKHPLSFKNGKLLIYYARFSLSRTLKDYFLHIVALITFGYLLYWQVNFATYPIIKHIYIAGVGITLAFIARKFLRNHNVVRSIYLLEGGKAAEIHFMNQNKRKFFGQKLFNTYYNSLFVQPKESSRTYLGLFPSDISQLEKNPPFRSYWNKFYSNEDNILLIPTQYQQMNAELLIQVMNGKTISS